MKQTTMQKNPIKQKPSSSTSSVSSSSIKPPRPIRKRLHSTSVSPHSTVHKKIIPKRLLTAESIKRLGEVAPKYAAYFSDTIPEKITSRNYSSVLSKVGKAMRMYYSMRKIQRWFRDMRKRYVNDTDFYDMSALPPVTFHVWSTDRKKIFRFHPAILVRYMIQTGQFSNPYDRNPFSDSDLHRLDYLLNVLHPGQFMSVYYRRSDLARRHQNRREEERTVDFLVEDTKHIINSIIDLDPMPSVADTENRLFIQDQARIQQFGDLTGSQDQRHMREQNQREMERILEIFQRFTSQLQQYDRDRRQEQLQSQEFDSFGTVADAVSSDAAEPISVESGETKDTEEDTEEESEPELDPTSEWSVRFQSDQQQPIRRPPLVLPLPIHSDPVLPSQSQQSQEQSSDQPSQSSQHPYAQPHSLEHLYHLLLAGPPPQQVQPVQRVSQQDQDQYIVPPPVPIPRVSPPPPQQSPMDVQDAADPPRLTQEQEAANRHETAIRIVLESIQSIQIHRIINNIDILSTHQPDLAISVCMDSIHTIEDAIMKMINPSSEQVRYRLLHLLYNSLTNFKNTTLSMVIEDHLTELEEYESQVQRVMEQSLLELNQE